MFRNLMWKEVLAQILSTRFLFSVVVALVLMLLSSWVLVRSYRGEVGSYQAFKTEHTQQIGSYETGADNRLAALSMGGRILDRRPSELSFLVPGVSRELPKSYWLSSYDGPTPETNLVGNRLRELFELVDLRFIVGVIFSLLALVLSYDAINGERQAGTLKMILANPVSLRDVLAAKWLAINLVLGTAFLLAFLAALLLAAFDPLIDLGPLAGRLAGIGLVSLLYMAVFVSLGLLFSSLFTAPASAMAISLLAWVLLVFVVPGAAPYLGATTVGEPPSYASSVAVRQDDLGYDYRTIRQEHLDAGHDWATANRMTLEFWREVVEPERARHVARTNQTFMNRKARLAERGQRLAMLSPYGLFSLAVTRLAGTGVEEQIAFERAAERYRQQFTDFIRRREGAGDPDAVSAADVPVFRFAATPPGEVAADLLVQVGVLALLAILLWATTFVRMLRYDVR